HGLPHYRPAVVSDRRNDPAPIVRAGLAAYQSLSLEASDLAGEPTRQRRQCLGEVAHPGAAGRCVVERVEDPDVEQRKLVQLGESTIERRIQPQGGIQEVLPRLLLSN